MTTLDGPTKETLRKTVRSLRDRLIEDLHAATEGEYRLSVKADQAGLREAPRIRRARLEAWLDEQVRTVDASDRKDARARFRAQAEKEAAYTLVHRLVVVRQLEAHGLLKPAVLAGCGKDWRQSQALKELTEHAPELASDETEGFRFLLSLVFDELALDLPGLFGDVGLTSLIPVPTPTLKAVVEALASEELEGAWTDDTTIGWVYQYWNDPDREALDAKIARREKIAPHEIASKTQMFTERYMVEWLLQNSLGLTWLAICKKNGWTPDAERVLSDLDVRRADWRAQREKGPDAGGVALDALMPIHGELEEHWKYYVPQPIADELVEKAPSSIRDLKLLDPACGSGHFLVIAFDQLAALYREEARHRARAATTSPQSATNPPLPPAGEGGGEGQRNLPDEEIATSILEKNLHGIDIDPRAVQIAAAALYLKARSRAPSVTLRHLHLVAPAFRLGRLPSTDPAVVSLRVDLEREAGIPAAVTDKLLASLAGVDHLGSLLRVSTEVDHALRELEKQARSTDATQGQLFPGEGASRFAPQQVKLDLTAGGLEKARATVIERLETFLAAHTSAEDLGLRLDGEQLAAGVRFVRMAKEGTYDVVVGNPPYQGLSKTTDAFGYVGATYPRGKADLYAAFLERGLQLVRLGGVSAMVVMRNWMFLGQYTELRKYLLESFALPTLLDLDSGAFEEISAAQVVVSVACSVHLRARPVDRAVAIRPTPMEDRASNGMTDRKRAGLLAQVGRHDFDPRSFVVIDGAPIVYWWTKEFLKEYADAPKLGEVSPARFGLTTGNNERFVRLWHEVRLESIHAVRVESSPERASPNQWVPFVLGGKGRTWIEPLREITRSRPGQAEFECFSAVSPGAAIRNPSFYFRRGIAFSMIGSDFTSRMHRYSSVIGNKGSSVFPDSMPGTLCLMNSALARKQLQSLNPGLGFEVGDVNRLAVFQVEGSHAIVSAIEESFSQHEAGREPSVEFLGPGPSAWAYAQDWAQRAVDRPAGAPLPPYEPVFEEPSPIAFVSFAIGVALGRFGANGEGVLDSAPASALPNGLLFVSAMEGDSLEHSACVPIHAAWAEHGSHVEHGASLREYLARSFFAYHKGLYENRPIYFPLSSSKKSFVVWVSIHRWTDSTLPTLLADHLLPTKKRLEGEIADLSEARASGDKKRVREAERRYAQLGKWREELDDFIGLVRDVAERGAPPVDDKCPKREVDAPFSMDLDDGVMINSAALWPLLEPQWKDPKKWWRELSSAPDPTRGTSGGAKAKDYDWAHLARRYWPTRVDAKCKVDPSLGVAHGCFWKYHPAKAYAWELRLQHEMEDEAFTIDEAGSDGAREVFLRDHADEAHEIREKEMKRRARKGGGEEEAQQSLGVDDGDEDDEGDA